MTPLAPVQAFWSYAQLAQLWQVHPETVREWVSTLRKERPTAVHVSYRLVAGHRRFAFVANHTAQAIQAERFPENAQPRKVRSRKPASPRTIAYFDRLAAAYAAKAAQARAPLPDPVAPQAVSQAAQAPTVSAPSPHPSPRRLPLPAMPHARRA